jgi:hypothetical protein
LRFRIGNKGASVNENLSHLWWILITDGGDGTLKLDDSSGFAGAVSGFNHGDSLDLGDVAFGSGTGTMLSYSANDAGTGGTLSVSDGANTSHTALEGEYTTSGFEGAYDQGSGTAVTYDTDHDTGGTDLKSVPQSLDVSTIP